MFYLYKSGSSVGNRTLSVPQSRDYTDYKSAHAPYITELLLNWSGISDLHRPSHWNVSVLLMTLIPR